MNSHPGLEQHSSLHSSPSPHPQRMNLAGASDRRDRVKARFQAAYEQLLKQPETEVSNAHTKQTEKSAKGNSWHQAKHCGADSGRDVQFVESLIDLIMKAPVDELPVPCRSQGQHMQPGTLQFARLQGIHRHQQPQRQPAVTEAEFSIGRQRVEQLLFHSRPPQQHSRPHPDRRCSPQSKQRKRRGTKRLQKQTPETPTGRSWVSIGAAADYNMPSMSPGASWLSPEAALSALSNATGTVNSTSNEARRPLAGFGGAFASAQQGAIVAPAHNSSEPQEAPAGTRIDLRCTVPVQGTPPELDNYGSIGSSVARRVVDAVIGETLDYVQIDHDEIDSGCQDVYRLPGSEDASSLCSDGDSQQWSSSVSEAGAVAADLSLQDLVHHPETQKCMPGGPRIFPALELCAEHSHIARRKDAVPARQKMLHMQAPGKKEAAVEPPRRAKSARASSANGARADREEQTPQHMTFVDARAQIMERRRQQILARQTQASQAFREEAVGHRAGLSQRASPKKKMRVSLGRRLSEYTRKQRARRSRRSSTATSRNTVGNCVAAESSQSSEAPAQQGGFMSKGCVESQSPTALKHPAAGSGKTSGKDGVAMKKAGRLQCAARCQPHTGCLHRGPVAAQLVEHTPHRGMLHACYLVNLATENEKGAHSNAGPEVPPEVEVTWAHPSDSATPVSVTWVDPQCQHPHMPPPRKQAASRKQSKAGLTTDANSASNLRPMQSPPSAAHGLPADVNSPDSSEMKPSNGHSAAATGTVLVQSKPSPHGAQQVLEDAALYGSSSGPDRVQWPSPERRHDVSVQGSFDLGNEAIAMLQPHESQEPLGVRQPSILGERSQMANAKRSHSRESRRCEDHSRLHSDSGGEGREGLDRGRDDEQLRSAGGGDGDLSGGLEGMYVSEDEDIREGMHAGARNARRGDTRGTRKKRGSGHASAQQRSAAVRRSRALKVWVERHAQQTKALETEHGLQQARSALLTALGGYDEQLCDGTEQLMSGTPRNGAMHSGTPKHGDHSQASALDQDTIQHVTVSRASARGTCLPPLPATRGTRPLTVASPDVLHTEGDDLRAKTAVVVASQTRGRNRSRASTAGMPAALMWLHWQQLGARPPSHMIDTHAAQTGEHPGTEPSEECDQATATLDIPIQVELSFNNDLVTDIDAKEGLEVEPSSRTRHSVAFSRPVAVSEITWNEPLQQVPTLMLQTPQEESTPRMERSAAVSWKRSDSGLLSMCTQACAQRRSQTTQALTAGGVPASSQAAGRLSATAGSVLRANTTGSEAVLERSRAGSRHALEEMVATLETEGRGGDSRAVAAHSHHRMMRMLASEQRKLPPAKGHMRNDVRVFRVDATAQVEADEVLCHASQGTVGQRVCATSYFGKHQRLQMPPMPLRLSTLQPQKKKD